MVAPKVKQEAVIPCSTTHVAIIGGGVVGVIAANRMRERSIDYRVIERLHDFGGVWHTHSNNHSTLQVPLWLDKIRSSLCESIHLTRHLWVILSRHSLVQRHFAILRSKRCIDVITPLRVL